MHLKLKRKEREKEKCLFEIQEEMLNTWVSNLGPGYKFQSSAYRQDVKCGSQPDRKEMSEGRRGNVPKLIAEQEPATVIEKEGPMRKREGGMIPWVK